MAKEGFITRAISLYVPWPDTAGKKFDRDAIYDGVNNIGKALEKICGAQFNHFDNVDCEDFRFQMKFFIKNCKKANPKPHQAIVYISTYGILHPTSNEIYLMMNDSPNPESDPAFFENSIPGGELRGYVEELEKVMPEGKVLVLVDCCHAGALIERDETLGYTDEALGYTDVRNDDVIRAAIRDGKGLVYFVSCRRSEDSLIVVAGPRRGPHFTNAVAKVLMEAPKGEVIKFTELVPRVKSEVEESSGGRQHPYWSERGQRFGAAGVGYGREKSLYQDQKGLLAGGTAEDLHGGPSDLGNPASSPARVSSAALSDKEFLGIADEINDIWQRVGTLLDLKRGTLVGIAGNLSYGTPERKAFEMLVRWHNSPTNPSRLTLADALDEAGRRRLAQKVREYQQPSANPPWRGRLRTELHTEEGHQAATPRRKRTSQPEGGSRAKKARHGSTPTLRELMDLSREVIAIWFRLGLALGVSEKEMRVIKNDNRAYQTDEDKAAKMLETWHDKGSSSTYEKLEEALCSLGKDGLADKYC